MFAPPRRVSSVDRPFGRHPFGAPVRTWPANPPADTDPAATGIATHADTDDVANRPRKLSHVVLNYALME